MRSASGLYISNIDHLRFVAALLVLWFHFYPVFGPLLPYSYVPEYSIISILDEGHTGVSLFLVLSGFIFTLIVGDSNIKYGQFIKNRILRIAPLAIFWMLLYFYINPKINAVEFVVGLLTTIAHTRESIPGVGWTIIVEYQFYLIFPFLILFFRKYGIMYLIACILLMVSVRTLTYLTYSSVHFISAFTIFGKIDQFLLGMIAAIASRQYAAFARRWSWLLFALGLFIVTTASHTLNSLGGMAESPDFASKLPIWIIYPTWEGIGYAALILGYVAMPWQIPRFIDRPLAGLGAISYSLYWCHVPLFEALRQTGVLTYLVGDVSSMIWVFVLIALPACIVLSKVTFELIERPFLELRGRYIDLPASDAR